MCKAAVPASICIDIKECSSMPFPFAYPVFVNGHGTIIVSCIDWNKNSAFPSWVRYKLYLYVSLGMV
jgi:hypothetical protein